MLRRHGLLSRLLVFQTEEEKEEFNTLLAELHDEYRPIGQTNQELVEEAAVIFWKLPIANSWEMQELANQRKASGAILRSLAENYDGEQLPLFDEPDGSPSAARLGWDCQELIVRTGTRNCSQESADSLGDKMGKTGHVQIEAKMNTSLDTIPRYQAALRGDLYRAIATLRAKPREGARKGTNGTMNNHLRMVCFCRGR
jgi:hypothetical protein